MEFGQSKVFHVWKGPRSKADRLSIGILYQVELLLVNLHSLQANMHPQRPLRACPPGSVTVSSSDASQPDMERSVAMSIGARLL